jgi:hypothetical protein
MKTSRWDEKVLQEEAETILKECLTVAMEQEKCDISRLRPASNCTFLETLQLVEGCKYLEDSWFISYHQEGTNSTRTASIPYKLNRS